MDVSKQTPTIIDTALMVRISPIDMGKDRR
jgi:hypothetical protein